MNVKVTSVDTKATSVGGIPNLSLGGLHTSSKIASSLFGVVAAITMSWDDLKLIYGALPP
eukprot:1798173-Amphidinium_carterae.1